MRPPHNLPLARPCALRPGGKRFYRFTVKVVQEGIARDFWRHEFTVPVIAETPAAAIDRVRQDLHTLPLVAGHPVNWHCAGPRGGETYRFTGYESLVWAEMCRARPTSTQLALL